MRSRLTRLEKATHALNGGLCPTCAGRDGQGFNARIWLRAGDAAPVLSGASSYYDDTGRCVRCGARARDIVMHVPGFGQGAREEGE